MRKMALVIAVMSVLIGCGQEPKSAQYFSEHRDELTARIERCKADRDSSQECMNASQAAGLSLMTTGRKRVRTIEEIEAENAKR